MSNMNDAHLTPHARQTKNLNLAFMRHKKCGSQGSTMLSTSRAVLLSESKISCKRLSRAISAKDSSTFAEEEKDVKLPTDIPTHKLVRRRAYSDAESGIPLNGRISKSKDELYEDQMNFVWTEYAKREMKKASILTPKKTEQSNEDYYTTITLL